MGFLTLLSPPFQIIATHFLNYKVLYDKYISMQAYNVSVIADHSLSCVCLSVTPWSAAHQDSLSFAISLNLLKLMSIESVMPSNHLILSCPLLHLPLIFPSMRVFSTEFALCIRWSKYWSFSISPSNEYSELISFRIDWFDLAVPGTLKSLHQNHSSKTSIIQCSAFFMVQLSHPYMTSGKTTALTKWTFVGKVMFCFLTCCVGLS